MHENTLIEPRACPLVVLHDRERRRWLRFARPRQLLVGRRLEEVIPVLRQAEEAVTRQGLYAAGFLSYEAAPAFDSALTVKADGRFPLAWFGLFEGPDVLEHLPSPTGSSLGQFNWQPSITSDDYGRGVERIRQLIHAGETYQVNFTYRLKAAFPPSCSPWELFLELMEAQEPPYGAFVDTGDWVVCSASPELFFRLDGRQIQSRPMKGTAARALWYGADRKQAARLVASKKERAENVMILDMVRNDLGKIAQIGSVRVPALFQVERYPTVWQMTSTVAAETDASFSQILQALFPPASITGAPKPRTMEIIAALESTPRRIYTGMVGFFGPGRRAQFSVAIRTLLTDRAQARAEYGVGGGIVWDSHPQREAQECQTKGRILRAPPPAFDLLETILWTPEQGYWLLPYHLKRLGESAAYFGFGVDLAQVQRHLQSLTSGFPSAPCKVRLRVSRKGAIHADASPAEARGFADLVLARTPIDASNSFLYHKTTNRLAYQEALRSVPGSADVLLFNEQGEITESTIANVAIERCGQLYTPPLRCGLLPGTCRAWLLEQKRLCEEPISIQEILRNPKVFLFNSIRGIHPVAINSFPAGKDLRLATQSH